MPGRWSSRGALGWGAAFGALGLAVAGSAGATTTPPAPPATTAAASTAPATTVPPADTGFLRSQAEAEFGAEVPDATQVACAVPPADEPGVQFLCYGVLADGSVVVRQVTMNDDGGLVLTAVAAPGPTTTAAPTPSTFGGSGSGAVDVPVIAATSILAITHDGAGDLTVQAQNAGVPVGAPIVVPAAAASSRHLVGLDGPVTSFAVTATGAWTLAVSGVADAVPLGATDGASGTAADVVRFDAGGPATVDFQGSGPIVITSVTAGGRRTLLDETGPFAGPVTIPGGPGFLAVDATGPWTIAIDAAPPDTGVG